MVFVSSSNACMPQLPASAAEALTVRSPESVVLDVHPDKSPDSKASAKIRSTDGVGDGVKVAVGPPGVLVAVGVFVIVGVGVNVAVGPPGVLVAVAVGVLVFVAVGVLVGPDVGVAVGAVPFPDTETRRFSTS